MNKTATLNPNLVTVITDCIVLVLVYFIPALSHLSSIPLYYLDPMRLLLFSAFLISRNKGNALILAATMPLFSSFVAHHPPFFKAILISVELLVNIAVFQWMISRLKWQPGIVIFIAAVISKLLYYGFKFVFIKAGLIEGALITTDILTQLYTLAGLSLLFAFFYKRNNAAAAQ